VRRTPTPGQWSCGRGRGPGFKAPPGASAHEGQGPGVGPKPSPRRRKPKCGPVPPMRGQVSRHRGRSGSAYPGGARPGPSFLQPARAPKTAVYGRSRAANRVRLPPLAGQAKDSQGQGLPPTPTASTQSAGRKGDPPLHLVIGIRKILKVVYTGCGVAADYFKNLLSLPAFWFTFWWAQPWTREAPP
jgi:hypothetical protein